MKTLFMLVPFLSLLSMLPAAAQQEETFDYWQPNRMMIRHGQQAMFMCNGLFTSNRTLEQIFEQELAYLPNPIGTASGGDYSVDWERKAVSVGNGEETPIMRAAFRRGVGCVIMAPDQTLGDIDTLPEITMPPLSDDTTRILWPDGDLIPHLYDLPEGVDINALIAASDWTFDRESEEQVTLSLLVIHNGAILHEDMREA